MAPMYGEEEDLEYTVEDCVWPTLGTAMVKWVLPSNLLEWQVVSYYREPSPD